MTTYRPKGPTEYMFKIVRHGGDSIFKGPYATTYTYTPNHNWQKPIRDRLISCMRGYHCVRLRQLPNWLRGKPPQFGFKIFLVKVDMSGAIDSKVERKVVVRNFRFVCELETTRNFIGPRLYTGMANYYSRINVHTFKPAELYKLANKWGLSVDKVTEKITGEYENLSLKG